MINLMFWRDLAKWWISITYLAVQGSVAEYFHPGICTWTIEFPKIKSYVTADWTNKHGFFTGYQHDLCCGSHFFALSAGAHDIHLRVLQIYLAKTVNQVFRIISGAHHCLCLQASCFAGNTT